VYGQTARSLPLARSVVAAAQAFSTQEHQVAVIGLAGTAHQVACEEAGVRFIPGKLCNRTAGATLRCVLNIFPSVSVLGLTKRNRVVRRFGLRLGWKTAHHQVRIRSLSVIHSDISTPLFRIHEPVSKDVIRARVCAPILLQQLTDLAVGRCSPRRPQDHHQLGWIPPTRS
jgi:hypothetical protein